MATEIEWAPEASGSEGFSADVARLRRELQMARRELAALSAANANQARHLRRLVSDTRRLKAVKRI